MVVEAFAERSSAMDEHMGDQFPALLGHSSRLIDDQKVDAARRVLWRAFQRGTLSEKEFAITLERLALAAGLPETTVQTEGSTDNQALDCALQMKTDT